MNREKITIIEMQKQTKNKIREEENLERQAQQQQQQQQVRHQFFIATTTVLTNLYTEHRDACFGVRHDKYMYTNTYNIVYVICIY